MNERIARRLADLERRTQQHETRLAPQLPELTAKHLGLKADGAADVVPKLQDGIDYLHGRGGGVIRLTYGDYLAKTGQVRPRSNVHIIGDGPQATRIVQDPTNDTVGVVSTFDSGDAVPTVEPAESEFTTDWSIQNLTIVGDDSYRYKIPLRLWLCRRVLIRNVVIDGGTHGGLVLEHFAEDVDVLGLRVKNVKHNPADLASGFAPGGGGIGVWVYRAAKNISMWNVTVEDVDGSGVAIDAGTEDRAGLVCDHVSIHRLVVKRTGLGNLVNHPTTGLPLMGMNGTALTLDGATNTEVVDYYFEDIQPASVLQSSFGVLIERDQSGVESNDNTLAHGRMKNIAGAPFYIAGSSRNRIFDLTVHNLNIAGGDQRMLVRIAGLQSSPADGALPAIPAREANDNLLRDVRVRQDSAYASDYNYFMLLVSDDQPTYRNNAIDVIPGSPTVAVLASSGASSPEVGEDGNYVRQLYAGSLTTGTDDVDAGKRLYGHYAETDAGGQRVGASGVAELTTTANDSTSNPIGVEGDAAIKPDALTTHSYTLGVRGVSATGRNLGAGIANLVTGLMARFVGSGGGNTVLAIAGLFKAPTLSGGSTITTAMGARIENQGGAGRTHAYALWLDEQTGASTTNRTLHVNGGQTYLGGDVQTNGGVRYKRTAVADANYTILTSDYYVAVTSLTASRTLTLPAAASALAGKTYVIKDESGSAATWNIVIDGAGAELIDGAATVSITTNRGSVRLYCTGTGWAVV